MVAVDVLVVGVGVVQAFDIVNVGKAVVDVINVDVMSLALTVVNANIFIVVILVERCTLLTAVQ